ncbi:hypothetical protein CMUS01_00424 [Colletotrichum musicola]|uniref:Uncharacterized protein n=1 Tax=Colletotrichum musicola TaxID=2175873 RepID=A0A8H6U9Q5_9PEZI|nr:hypothetical protein CMUS01_00424 [Colletotrichum musicola]
MLPSNPGIPPTHHSVVPACPALLVAPLDAALLARPSSASSSGLLADVAKMPSPAAEVCLLRPLSLYPETRVASDSSPSPTPPPYAPPTLSMVKGDAVGPSSAASS